MLFKSSKFGLTFLDIFTKLFFTVYILSRFDVSQGELKWSLECTHGDQLGSH